MNEQSIIRDLLFWLSVGKKKELIDKINKALDKIKTSSNNEKKQDSEKFLRDVSSVVEPKKLKEDRKKRIKKILGKNSIYSWIYK